MPKPKRPRLATFNVWMYIQPNRQTYTPLIAAKYQNSKLERLVEFLDHTGQAMLTADPLSCKQCWTKHPSNHIHTFRVVFWAWGQHSALANIQIISDRGSFVPGLVLLYQFLALATKLVVCDVQSPHVLPSDKAYFDDVVGGIMARNLWYMTDIISNWNFQSRGSCSYPRHVFSQKMPSHILHYCATVYAVFCIRSWVPWQISKGKVPLRGPGEEHMLSIS